jgi:DNA-directed RNA polymerase subunit RPC12/RpoP
MRKGDAAKDTPAFRREYPSPNIIMKEGDALSVCDLRPACWFKGNALACPECGSTSFVQKEVRKTGVVIIDGRTLYRDPPHPNRVITAFICARCKLQVPSETAKKCEPLRSDEARLN